MYVVLITNKSKEPFSDMMPELTKAFPNEVFTIEGSEEKGYKLRIEGTGDEKAPRVFAKEYMKTWKPKPPDLSTPYLDLICPPKESNPK